MSYQNPITFPQQFPTNNLPPMIRAAVLEAIEATKAPEALIASTALAAASLAVQSRFDVKRSKNLKSPCSLYFLTFAESGERKTTVDELFFHPFRQFEKVSHNHEADKDSDKNKEKNEIKAFRILYSDTTPMGFLEGLSKNGNSAGLIEDEAGRIFKGKLIDDLGLLNKLWGGQTISVDRRNSSFTVHSPRATINWMVQPHIFRELMERKGEDIRSIGFLARCLVCHPVSTQGWRFMEFEPTDLPKIELFQNRALDLLNEQVLAPVENGVTAKSELHFSSNGQHEWVNVFNRIEQTLQPGGLFCQSRDYASKVAEMIARASGVIHAFEGYDGLEISVETIRSATSIVLWYANEFLRLFSPLSPMDVRNRDALTLDSWLINWVLQGGSTMIRKNDLLQLAPKSLRSRAVMDMCLATLGQWGRITFQQAFTPCPTSITGTAKRPTQFITLGPYYNPPRI